MRFLRNLALLSVAMPMVLAAQDSAGVQRTANGYRVDFDNQPVHVVLSALAEAAGVNITFSNLPQARTTLHLGQPVAQEQLIDVIRGIAEQNELEMTRNGPLIVIGRARGRGERPTPTPQNQPILQLYTYRLKYAGAAQLAPVLMNLFTGTGSGDPRAGNRGGWGGGGGGGGQNTSGGVGTPGASASTVALTVPQQPAPAVPQQPAPAGGPGSFGLDGRAGGALPDNLYQVRIVAEETTNTLLIRATPEAWAWIKQLVETIDLRPLQVLIEAVIVEVTRTRDLNVGVDATVTRDAHGQRVTADLPSIPDARDFLLQVAGGRGAVDFTAALNALATRGDLRVRSLPVIVAQNNQQALLNVGASRPFVSVSQTVPNDPTGRVETIQYLDVGTRLQITPRINPDGYVNMEVMQTANNATNEIQFDAPVLSRREATTQVFLKDGQTTVLGGLSDRTRDEVRSGVPILRSLPIIGGLFGTTRRSDVQSELYLFLTPHIISDDADVDRYRDALHRKSEELQRNPITPVFPSPVPRDSTP